MIDAKRLLSNCQALVRQLEADIRNQLDERPDLQALLKHEHHKATVAKRTRRSDEDWTVERITQAAVAWVLGCVFVRFLEDNALVDTPRMSGTGVRLQRARDEETHYFQQHPERTAREYLEDGFRVVAALPGCASLFDEQHNPLWQLPISGDAARDLLEHWRAIDPQSGTLIHDFADQAWGTRFVGDLYQDLSEAARKQYALLQTPEFIEEFILERTLEPAVDEFGLGKVTLIDPACGSGHFLLGAFHRLLGHWREEEPGEDVRVHVERALAAIAGVDLNPFAAAIARFRLLVAALKSGEVKALRNAPDFKINIAVGDSLLHTPRRDRLDVGSAGIRKGLEHVYATEDTEDLQRILSRQYHAVVANPPYITPKDAALNQAYRDLFDSCSGKYALSVPFMELLFDLAIGGGHVGQITSNSFMKREFGRKLVEKHLARLDLTLIVDTSVAYIPGHGTPTVILIGRNRAPLAPTVRTVMGIRGEPSTPADPAHGLVWTSIVEQVDRPGSDSAYLTVEDDPRERYAKHPWSIGGGGVNVVRETIAAASTERLGVVATRIGFFGITGFADLALAPLGAASRGQADRDLSRPIITGELVRDFSCSAVDCVYFPYWKGRLIEYEHLGSTTKRLLWPHRSLLASRPTFSGRTYADAGEEWHKWHQLPADTIDSRPVITFAEVATHNHFALERRRFAFKETAPVMKLPAAASDDDYLGLLGLLNSSTVCFWLMQVCHNKGGPGGASSKDEKWHDFYQFNGTKVGQLPLPDGRPLTRARRLDALAHQFAASLPGAVEPTREALGAARERADALRAEMIAVQEELDWEVYGLYGLLDGDLTHPEPPLLRLGERTFEIVLARRTASGEERTTWFERHASTPMTELPDNWPESYRALIERRLEVIESNRNIGLIERPEHKRRWQWEPWEEQQEQALREWLLNRLEEKQHWTAAELTSCARLTDEARNDPEFRSVAELYAARPDVDLAKLVETLVVDEAVPYLAAWRYTADGMRVRAAWERTWDLQRCEDAIDALGALQEADPQRLTPEQAKARKQVEVGQIPVPPKYTSKHFRKGAYWQLRGKLDVPKERFILFPGCERAADPSPVIGWAGWNHLERSQALAQYVTRMRQEERWEADRLTPLLAGLAEQLPWVMQWHNDFDASLGRRVGDAYGDFLSGQLAELGLSTEDLAEWRPLEATRGRRTRKVAV